MTSMMMRRTAYAAGLTAAALSMLAASTTATAQAAPANPTGLLAKESANSAAASPIAESYPDAAIGDGVTAGGYNQSRWAEDWSKLRDPKKRKDIVDQLKFISLAGDGDVYLTLSGEARLRVNQTTNPNLRDAEAQRQDILRLFGGADLHVGKHVRFYGELAHGTLEGENLGTALPNLRNKLAVQQAFVDLTGTVADVDVGVRYGRQTFADGPNLMVVPRDNNTLYFGFNGFRAWARAAGVRADVFDFKPTAYGNGGTQDDNAESARRFSGISTGIVVPETLFGGSKLYVDPFLWRLRNRTAVWGTDTAREVRNFYGLHVWGDAGPVNLDWTINYQGGSYDNRSIKAWLVLLAQTYQLGKGKTAPRVGFHADYASGGGAYGKGTLRNSLAPFGNNIYYSYQLFATPTNLIALAPNVTFSAFKKLRMTAEYQLSWRDTTTDAVYRANGTAFAGTQNFGGRKIADTIRFQATYPITSRLSLLGRYEHLIAGPALTNAGYKNSDFMAGWISYRF
ncbi:alginate export protein [Sphingomonas aurantiaca]|uniref:Alginate export protein n=2 Tax=Sphingomonas aurantiaca TaxID=185949 RepID=A0A2T5GSZ2_9SPHN|nr:alginate export family protein [Sphingomonas aurantiaca]PTQ62452.1 alginate export protein [Sphingomonas aurantiaca]